MLAFYAAPETPDQETRICDENGFRHRGYLIDCAPRELADGTSGAQAVLTKIGYYPEKTFDALPVFPNSSVAGAHAKKFAGCWLEGKA